MAVSFVKIHENRILLECDGILKDAKNIRVLSILGKARMGKSTFLNAIASHVVKRTLSPFQTQDDDEHCTRGVDAYFLPEASLLLLDFQGLALEDSSHDPALLLFAYRISDLLILNERMMLQNEALKLMEPICAFMQYIDEETPKPTLYFRVSDGDIVSNPIKNLDKVMATYNDQYQSIRDSIRTLFRSEIGIVKTDTLDRNTKLLIQKGEYAEFLKTETFGFCETIRAILGALPEIGHSAPTWWSHIPIIVESINQNKKITIDKLDVVGQTAKLEILEWIQNLPKSLFEPLVVDGFQVTYDAVAEPKKLLKKTTLGAFTRKFRSVAENLKAPYYRQLVERLQESLDVAEKESVAKAEERVKATNGIARQNRTFPVLNSVSGLLASIPDTYWTQSYFTGYEQLRTVADPVYESVRKKYIDWLETQELAVKMQYTQVFNEEQAEMETLKAEIDQKIVAFEGWVLARLKANQDGNVFTNSDLLRTNRDILIGFVNEFRNTLLMTSVGHLKCRTFVAHQKEGVIQVTCDTSVYTTDSILRVCEVKTILEDCMKRVDVLVCPEGSLWKWIVKTKEAKLLGKHMEHHVWMSLKNANPNIAFWEKENYWGRLQSMFSGGAGVIPMRFTTTGTFNAYLLPMMSRCKEKLVHKGYASATWDFEESLACKKHYDSVAVDQFVLYMKKEWMRMCVKCEQTELFTL